MTKERVFHEAPPNPAIGFSLGVTGHRKGNVAFSINRASIETVLSEIFNTIGSKVAHRHRSAHAKSHLPIRLHSLLVDGLDQIAARQALSRNWELVAPLPFGRLLNTAINAHPVNETEAKALMTNGICSDETRARATEILDLISQAQCFELAEQDEMIGALFIDKLAAANDMTKAQAFSFAASERVALAAQVLIEQSDLIIGVWDGVSTSYTGGTGHTIALALAMGAPVLWINANTPQDWRLLYTPEELVGRHNHKQIDPERNAALAHIIMSAMQAREGKNHGPKSSHRNGLAALDSETWHRQSDNFWHAYRRVEALFGSTRWKDRFRSLRQTYEAPTQIALGSANDLLTKARALPGQAPNFIDRIETTILHRFAWADAISSRLSDTYRGGMILNFVFSAFAIVGGMAYLPFASGKEKWLFALFELALLGAILAITFFGQKRRWHGRWFETRRVAEYLRHAPILVLLGIARPTGRWPKGNHTSWPEHYVRHTLRSLALPNITITTHYLRSALQDVFLPYVKQQIDYHHGKAKRLAKVHHSLDKVAELLFKLAVASVSAYLFLKLGVLADIVASDVTDKFSKLFTFLGVIFPTFGAAIAGVRYFGDFERFSAISDVTAQKLDGVATRIQLLLLAPIENLSYAHVADLAHTTDDIVIAEIESWQAVFSGKHITVPV